jgi:hypothetical protein
MKLPPIIHLFEVTLQLTFAPASDVAGGRKRAWSANFKMVCPPATSEAGARTLEGQLSL